MKRLAIITTHPIQYYAPLFQLLSQNGRLPVKVFYTWGEQARSSLYDPGFGKERAWDIPLLEGYDYEFVTNTSASPGSHHFKGIVNPHLIATIRAWKADAVLMFGWAFQSHLKVMHHFKGKLPVYFRGDSTLLDEPAGFSPRKLMRRLFLKWVYRYIDLAFYVGTNNKRYYLTHGLKEKQLVYAPHAIDNIRFFENEQAFTSQAEEWKVSLGIAADKAVILFAGKLEPKKNPMFIIEAAKQLPLMHFIIVGNGFLENDIKQAATSLKNVTILPFQNQSIMPVVYRLCDVFVLPSQGPGETWGLAINEAMASGRIVIASNKCGGAIDLIDDGVNGFIINPDPNALIEALQRMGNDKSNYDSFKAASLQRIKNFTYEQIVSAIERTCASTQFA